MLLTDKNQRIDIARMPENIVLAELAVASNKMSGNGATSAKMDKEIVGRLRAWRSKTASKA